MSNEVESEETDQEIYKTLGYEDQSDYFDKRLPIYNDFLSFEEYSKQLEAKSIPDIVENLDENLDDTEIKFSEEPVEFDYTPNMFYANLAKDVYQDVSDRKGFLKYKYIEDESSENLATYINEEKKELAFAIAGTSKAGDMIMDAGIAIASAPLLGFDGRYEKINNKIKEVKSKYDDYSVSVTGHSAGGSLANYLGVENPDYAVNTFNMGQGLPFLTNTIKCKLGNCENINNFRIVGDWASSLSDAFSPGKVFNMKPIVATDEMAMQSDMQESFYYPTYMNLPHNINQFIDRDKNQELPDYAQYGRKLTASLTGLVSAYGLPYAVDYYDTGIKKNIQTVTRKMIDENTKVMGAGVAYNVGLTNQLNMMEDQLNMPDLRYNLENLIKNQDITDASNNIIEKYNKENPIKSTSSNVFNKLNNLNEVFSTGLGYGIGDIFGTAVYDTLLKPEITKLKGKKEEERNIGIGDVGEILLVPSVILLSDILANKYTNRYHEYSGDILENHYAYISPDNFP